MGPESGELPSWPPVPSGGQTPYFYSAPPTPTRRRGWRYVAAGGVLAVAAVAGVVAAGASSHHSLTLTLAPGAFVSAAAHQTIGQKTADVVLGGTMHVKQYTMAIHGRGEVDFANHGMDMRMQLGVAGHTVSEDIRLVDHSMYLSYSLDGTNGVLQQTGTASWIAMPIAQSITSGGGGTDPAATLSMLEKRGAAVQTLGTRAVDGVDCFGFSVTPTAAMMVQAQKAEADALGLTPTQEAQILSQVNVQPPTITMWIDRQKVLRQMSESLQMTIAGAGTGSGQIVMDFKGYGLPVEISPPPASEVIPFSQYMSQAGSQAAG